MFDMAGRYYKPDCSLEEAVALMAKWVQPRAPVKRLERARAHRPHFQLLTFRRRCVTEVNQRFLVGGAKFKCKVVDKVMPAT